MNKTRLVMIAVVLSLDGCAALVKPMKAAYGKQGFLVLCDNSADDWTSYTNLLVKLVKESAT